MDWSVVGLVCATCAVTAASCAAMESGAGLSERGADAAASNPAITRADAVIGPDMRIGNTKPS